MSRGSSLAVALLAGCLSTSSSVRAVSELRIDRGWLIVRHCDYVLTTHDWFLPETRHFHPPERTWDFGSEACGETSQQLPVDLRGPDARATPPITLPPPSDSFCTVLLARAQHAAKFHDCRSVRRFARVVRERDERYYREVFAFEPTLAPCLPPDGGAP